MKILYFICFCIMQLALSSAVPKGLLTQDIHDNWKFRVTENTTYYNATVPGTVHTDLLNNQLIPDPYYRDNVNSVQWIENKTWEYTTQFDISSPDLLNQSRIDLVFEGLDTYASVSLNGQTILQANNMFRRWVVDVKSLLKSQGNTLTIVFNSTIPYDDEQIQNMLPLVLPSDFDSGRIFTRKAAYHYGWDWGPRLVTAGIWRPVYLQAWSSARIDYVQFNQKVITNTLAQVEANLELIVDKTQDYQISVLDSNSKQVYITTHKTIQSSNSTQVPVAFQIKNPKLWWVRNFGDPYLYNITVQISSGGVLLDQKVLNLGIRTIELVQEDDSIGKSFYFKINGQKVFAKGGNYIPPDVFMPRVTTADYEAILGDAIAANYNFIRLWGGGNFENDIFYDICDREGILLWHDFMFGNGMYPANSDDFLQNIAAEITDNVKRIRNHPSIVLWCGNNEIKNGWEDWSYQQNMTDQQKVTVYGWYMKIFLDVIPGVLQQTDPSRPYWPTSPEIGYGHPESYVRGDNHYYSVWVLNAPIENYTLGIGRFMSEYGMQGLPCMNSVKKFTIPEDLDLNSTVILAHEKGSGAYGHIDYYMTNYYKPTVGFENYLYATQIMQKYAIQTAVEAHRWNKPRNMGTLMWQLNDDWPSFSWSSRDYYGTWKAVHYMLKKKYQDVIVSIVPDVDLNNNTQYQVYIVSEKLNDFKGSLHLSILDFDGTVRLTMDTNVSVPADSSQPYYTIGNYHIHDLNLNSSFVYATLTYDFNEKFSDTTSYFVRPIYMNLVTPKITINANLNANQITIQADTFVVGAYIYIDGVDLHLDDNYFDLLPNQPKTVNVLKQKLENIANLKDDLKVMTLYDSYSTDREAPKVKIVEETKVILE